VPINAHDIGMHPCAGTKVSGASDDRLNIYDSEALGGFMKVDNVQNARSAAP
jgi:hypothetical protein